MDRSYLKIVILSCIQQLQGQRTIYSILHLLNGKKSSQTIQDAHLFQLTGLFGTFARLSRTELEQLAAEMEKVHWITKDKNGHYHLTAEGQIFLQKELIKDPIPATLNGWAHNKSADLLWERLSLLVQVISHLNHQHSKYLPIQRKKEVHIWLKGFLKTAGFARSELGIRLNNELRICLDHLKEINPAVLVLRLTGYKHIGLTSVQAAEQLGICRDHYHHQFLGILHYILDSIKDNPSRYPLLGNLISKSEESVPLTLSSKKTLSLLSQGLDIDEISRIRHLKRSTIEDHVVEVALNDSSFDISPYVTASRQKSILNAAKLAESRQLKQIRQVVPQSNYFEIRLVLAKFGEEK